MQSRLALLSLLFLSLGRLVLTYDSQIYIKCDYDSEHIVSTCLQPMLEYASQLQDDTGMQFPLHGGSIFHKLCSMYHQFQECVEGIKCSSLSIDAVSASYGYMCGIGMPLFEKHAACFAKVERESSYIKCKDEATKAMNAAQKKNQNSLNEEYLHSMCIAMDGYLKCSHPTITKNCGDEAWNLVSTVTRDSLRVTMPNCDMASALF